MPEQVQNLIERNLARLAARNQFVVQLTSEEDLVRAQESLKRSGDGEIVKTTRSTITIEHDGVSETKLVSITIIVQCKPTT